jgi:uncharacterized protein YndB with AHSA1/START domain
MSEEPEKLSFTQFVRAGTDQVYYAFTNATALREWLADVAVAVPQRGGRLYLGWNSGYYTAGEYTTVDPGQAVAFTWHGKGEPGTTQVKLLLRPDNGSTRVELEHSGLGSDPEWAKARQDIQRGWETGLENLASVLEAGQDLRFTRRPMLGIMLSDFNAETAAHLNVPVREGVRLDTTIEGMGAQAAGLGKDDVIVSMDSQPIIDYSSLERALQSHHAGDEIEVVFYRGKEKKMVRMTLSGRPIPEIPKNAKELAETVQSRYAQQNNELSRVFQGVTEEQASRQPEPGEWSAKEVLAHLIIDERELNSYISDLAGGQVRWSDDYTGNSHERVRAVVTVYPTVQALLEELKRIQAENVAFLAALPDSFIARKGSFWRIAYELVQPPLHTQLHIDQIQTAIQAS